MRLNLSERALHITRTALLSTFLGLAVGYTTFYSVFPNVTVPASEEPSLPLILGVLAMAGLLAGLMTEDLRMGVVQGFLSIPVGLVIAFALAISPVLTGFLEVQVDDIFSFITRLGLPIYLFALPLYIVTGIAGMLLRERFGLHSESFFAARPSPQRK
ncbi:MAG: hypothetical protein E6K00_07630 [Methanobacteriota archaeon]|nr:MAG: hypothetical protein E6K00_07630 [Euryarchaeota archaeon]